MAHILLDMTADIILYDVPHQQVVRLLQEQVVEPFVQVVVVVEVMVGKVVKQELLQMVHYLQYSIHHHTREDKFVGIEDGRKSQEALMELLWVLHRSGCNNPMNRWVCIVVHISDDIFHLL